MYRYSYMATRDLLSYGHKVVLVGKKNDRVFDRDILTEIPTDDQFDTVTLYLSEMNQKEYENILLDLNPGRIIFNPGAENPELKKRANEAGIKVLEACTLVMLSARTF